MEYLHSSTHYSSGRVLFLVPAIRYMSLCSKEATQRNSLRNILIICIRCILCYEQPKWIRLTNVIIKKAHASGIIKLESIRNWNCLPHVFVNVFTFHKLNKSIVSVIVVKCSVLILSSPNHISHFHSTRKCTLWIEIDCLFLQWRTSRNSKHITMNIKYFRIPTRFDHLFLQNSQWLIFKSIEIEFFMSRRENISLATPIWNFISSFSSLSSIHCWSLAFMGKLTSHFAIVKAHHWSSALILKWILILKILIYDASWQPF